MLADLVVEKEIGGGREIEAALVGAVRVDGEVEREGIIGGAGREHVLPVELHETVALMILGGVEARRTVNPEIVISGNSGEELGLGLEAQRIEDSRSSLAILNTSEIQIAHPL